MYVDIHFYQFGCDAGLDNYGPLCSERSPIIAGRNLADAAMHCESKYNWRIIMGRERPLFTYCPGHKEPP